MSSSGQRRWILPLAVIVVFVARSDAGNTNMEIRSMHIESQVTSRFARTFITTEVQNPSNSSCEATFDIELPKTAFITKFSMTVDNVTTVGTVKEKAEAKKTYQKAVSKGKSAGLVQSTGRKMEHFKISVNVGALAKATFKLTYEELLKRQLGNYELYLRVKPQGLVESFQISVDIVEPQGISFLKAVGSFISNDLTDIVQIDRTDTKAHVAFKPTLNQQRSCPNCLETLLNGDLVITYDVKRENSAGKLQAINGYFVHYFAPPSLQRIPKNVVFVIDRSGSMFGNKIKQTYEAFLKILEDVPQEDYFAILTFDDKVEKWKNQLVQAAPENIRTAKEFVSQINARGGTDINKALLTAVKMLTNATLNNMLPEVSASIIIFLSDGEPTSGTTNHDKIIDNVKRSMEDRASLYCLGFGNDLDYNFLEKLSLQNGGLARRIYEDSDSALQLQGFYNEVAYPMLLNVHLQYLDNSVDYLTQNSFRLYYQGSEIIVAGHIANDSLEVLRAEVTARGVSKPFSEKLETKVNEEEEAEKEQHYIFGDFIERLWAYLTIEQLMTKQISLEGEDKRKVMDKALNLSLKYNFVTPLTSLVVTRPEEEDTKMVANKPKEGDKKTEDLDYDDFPAPTANTMDSHYYVDYDNVYDDANAGASRLIHATSVTHNQVSRIIQAPTLIHKEVSLVIQAPTISHKEVSEDASDLLTGFTVIESTAITHTKVSNEERGIFTFVVETTADNSTKVTLVSHKFHVLLKEPKASDKICIKISEDNGGYINLLHDANIGITLNSKLKNDTSFARFGLVNSNLGVRVEIGEDKVTVTRGSFISVYKWNSSFELDGFLKKEGEIINVTITGGVIFTIFKEERSFHLSVLVEKQHSATNHASGVIGQLLNDGRIHIHPNTIVASDQVFTPDRATHLNLKMFGGKDDESCLYFILRSWDLITSESHAVSDIFTVPKWTSV